MKAEPVYARGRNWGWTGFKHVLCPDGKRRNTTSLRQVGHYPDVTIIVKGKRIKGFLKPVEGDPDDVELCPYTDQRKETK